MLFLKHTIKLIEKKKRKTTKQTTKNLKKEQFYTTKTERKQKFFPTILIFKQKINNKIKLFAEFHKKHEKITTLLNYNSKMTNHKTTFLTKENKTNKNRNLQQTYKIYNNNKRIELF